MSPRPRAPVKKKRCTLGDLWKCLSLGAPANTESAISAMAPSRTITRRMLEELKKANRQWEALTAYAHRQGWLDRRVQRPHPKAGETREYLVQEGGKQLFARVPVGILGVTRGQILLVNFSNDSVVIKRNR